MNLQIDTTKIPSLRAGAEVRANAEAGSFAGTRGTVTAHVRGNLWEVQTAAGLMDFSSRELTVLG